MHGPDVVDDLLDIARPVRVEDLGLGGEQVLKRALRPLDLAGEHRLLAHAHERVGVRQRQYGTVEPAERSIGVRQPPRKVTAEVEGRIRGERRGHERAIPMRLRDVRPRSCGRGAIAHGDTDACAASVGDHAGDVAACARGAIT